MSSEVECPQSSNSDLNARNFSVDWSDGMFVTDSIAAASCESVSLEFCANLWNELASSFHQASSHKVAWLRCRADDSTSTLA